MFRRFLQTNPILYMSRHLWRYAADHRAAVVLYVTLFVLGSIIGLLEPLIVSFLLNTVQTRGVAPDNLWQMVGYISLLLAADLAFWLFLGPARVIEQYVSFQSRAAYK